MVIDDLDYNGSGTRWANYLVLSLFVNALVISLISIDSNSITIPKTPLLKVKLISINPPKHERVKEVVKKQNTAVIEKKKVVTKNNSEKSIKKIIKREKQNPIKQKEIQIVKKEQKTVIDKTINIKKEPDVKKEIQKLPIIENKILENVAKNAITEVKEASYRKQIPPVYPRRAQELGQQGNVVLHALVKPDGFASELKIKDSSGHSLLDKAALAAVRKWEFEPTIKDGTTIASWVRVPIEFVIQ